MRRRWCNKYGERGDGCLRRTEDPEGGRGAVEKLKLAAGGSTESLLKKAKNEGNKTVTDSKEDNCLRFEKLDSPAGK